jgi:predicted N-acyltransferase
MASDVETRVFKTVDEIGEDAIDSIVDDGFFTYGWFKTLETSKPPIKLDPFYVTAYHKGELIAFTPCFRDIAGQYFQYGPEIIPYMKSALNVYNRLRLGQNNVLLCYSPWCFRTKVFFAKSVNQGDLLKKLCQSIDGICKKEKILFSSFLFVSDFDQNLKLGLEYLKYSRVLFWKPMLYLDVSWQTFEDYLKSLTRENRQDVRREMRRSIDNGVSVDHVTEFQVLSKTLSDLSFSNFLKHNKWAERLEPLFFESLSKNAKDNTVVFLARKKGDIIGFSLGERKDENLDMFMVGLDYKSLEKNDYTYFGLVYYAPISWAIQSGLRKIYYRWGSEEAKYARGCKPELLYSFVKCHNKLANSQIGNYLKIKKGLNSFNKA